jgi:hypothetical protein
MLSTTLEVIIPAFVAKGANVLSCDTAEADMAGTGEQQSRRTLKKSLSSQATATSLGQRTVKIHDINKSCLLEKKGLFDPKIALLRKILAGDKADNIPSKPRLGPKTAATLSNDPESLETLLSNPTVKASFDRNRMLIDLNASPDDLQMHVDSKFTVYINLCNAIPICTNCSGMSTMIIPAIPNNRTSYSVVSSSTRLSLYRTSISATDASGSLRAISLEVSSSRRSRSSFRDGSFRSNAVGAEFF